MEKSFLAFTLFPFLLFAISTARISLESPASYLPVEQSNDDASKSSSIKALPAPADVAVDSNIVLRTDNLKNKADETDHMLEAEKSRTVKVDLTPRSDLARFYAINRHFSNEIRIPSHLGHRHPDRHFVNPFLIPRSKNSHRKEVMLPREEGNVDSEHFHTKAPLKRLKPKHDHGHRHHRNQLHHLHHGHDDVSTPKHKFGREKQKSLVRQHKEKKREEIAGFMKGIRKFLKHTFD